MGSPLICAHDLQDLSCAPAAASVSSQVGTDEESNGGERTDDDAEGETDDSEEDDTNAGEDDDENPTSEASEPSPRFEERIENEDLPEEAEETPDSHSQAMRSSPKLTRARRMVAPS